MIACYLVSGRAVKNILLLFASLAFYTWGEPKRIVLMVVSIAFSWVSGIAIEKSSNRKKAYLVLDLILNFTAMGFFKHEAFFEQNANAPLGMGLVFELNLPLPVGFSFSFCTLQAFS